MKSRILPALGIVFATILVSRSIALSSEVSALKASEPAHEQNHKNEGTHAANTEARSTATPAVNAADEKICITGEVLKSVNKKMKTLDMREAEMEQQEAAFAAIKKRLNKELAIVQAAKAALDKDVEKRTDLAQGDITHLTTMYSTMKPKQAAKIFNNMDPKFAAGFLREMKSEHAGFILAAMETKNAYEVSLVIASRNARYRKRPATDMAMP